MRYEEILRRIAALITGRRELGERIETRGALNGMAEAAYWNKFENRNEPNIYDKLSNIIIGILEGLDVIRKKIEILESRLNSLEGI